MSSRNRIIGAFLLAILAFLIWWALDSTRPRATWLSVRASDPVFLGKPLLLELQLLPELTSGFLTVDLYGKARDGRPVTLPGAGRSQRISTNQGPYATAIPIPN